VMLGLVLYLVLSCLVALCGDDDDDGGTIFRWLRDVWLVAFAADEAIISCCSTCYGSCFVSSRLVARALLMMRNWVDR